MQSENTIVTGNPFKPRPSSSRAASAAANALEKALSELDSEQHMPENIDIDTWRKLISLRRTKVGREQQVNVYWNSSLKALFQNQWTKRSWNNSLEFRSMIFAGNGSTAISTIGNGLEDIVCTLPPFLQGGQGGWASNQTFQNGGLYRTSTFRQGLLGKRGWLYSGVVASCNFHKKIKSEIFNDKKIL